MRHPAQALSCTYLWKISADKHVLFIFSVNLILLVDFYIPDFSWHMTEKFNNNGEVALGSSSNHHAMKNKALFAFASTVTKRLQEKSPFLKIMSCLVLHCSVKVLMLIQLQTHFLLVRRDWSQPSAFTRLRHSQKHLPCSFEILIERKLWNYETDFCHYFPSMYASKPRAGPTEGIMEWAVGSIGIWGHCYGSIGIWILF